VLRDDADASGFAHAASLTEYLAELRAVIAGELPITQHLGITVHRIDASSITLGLPLAPNRNLHGTLFAGSLSAAAILAGWAVGWLTLRRAGLAATLVIQDSALDFLRPVTTDCSLVCHRAEPVNEDRFVQACRRHGRGRLALDVDVVLEGATVARFRGRYVALRERLTSLHRG
jgi:thioesterase domain-containing protein